MRSLTLTVAAIATLSALPASAEEKPFPTPFELRAVVDHEIALGGIGQWTAQSLRRQAESIVRLESLYAADRYSDRERRDIRRRSIYLMATMYTIRTGRTVALYGWQTYSDGASRPTRVPGPITDRM